MGGVCLVRGVPGPGGGGLLWGGAWSGGCLVMGRLGVPGGDPPMATAAGGTHPTGMHSCFNLSLTDSPRPNA